MKLFAIVVSLFSLGVHASSGPVDYLELDEKVVYFSTSEAKSHTLPGCVVPQKSNMWSVSLASDEGRAMYSMILTAMAKDSLGISVISGNDCGAANGVERAKGVSLVIVEESGNNSSNQSGGSSHGSMSTGLALYDGSGQNRLGAYLGTNGEDYLDASSWNYVNSDGVPTKLGNEAEGVKISTKLDIYFSEENCQGEAYLKRNPDHATVEELFYNFNHNDGIFLKIVGTGADEHDWDVKSYMKKQEGCNEFVDRTSGWATETGIHPICGESACKLK